MPWACSDPGAGPCPGVATTARTGRWRLSSLAILLLLPAWLAAPTLAQPRPAWLRGVFPVASFSGFTSAYGPRDAHGQGGDWHHGIDIAAPLGSPVRSWWSGRVSQVFSDAYCGTGLVVRSGDYEHVYCHLEGQVSADSYRSGAVWLRAGDRVRSGQTIGHVGLSGRTTGPHLHWGLRYRGEWLDPARILRSMAESRRWARQGQG